jgi:hypothetical protein
MVRAISRTKADVLKQRLQLRRETERLKADELKKQVFAQR